MQPIQSLTRRVAMTGTMAAGLLSLAAAPAKASPESDGDHAALAGGAHAFVHIFSFHWKDSAAATDRARAKQAITDLRPTIPGIRQLWLGENISEKAPGYTTTGVMLFDSERAYHAYTMHPAHVQLLQWLAPLISAIELDFDSASP